MSPQTSDSRVPTWRWRTFPVLAAFVFGLLVASFIDRPDSDFAVGVRIAAVIAAAACLAHIFVAYVIAPRRLRTRTGADGSGDDHAAFEDELIYDDPKH
ncbi:MAG: hypothetical protein HY873_13475 [Chloroflexi bacterium]|nr:hypothetical protein [Chloroflexota bacterium]